MLVVLPFGTSFTPISAWPELSVGGRIGDGPYDSKLRSSVAVNVPVTRTLPLAAMCVKVPPPVANWDADRGCPFRTR